MKIAILSNDLWAEQIVELIVLLNKQGFYDISVVVPRRPGVSIIRHRVNGSKMLRRLYRLMFLKFDFDEPPLYKSKSSLSFELMRPDNGFHHSKTLEEIRRLNSEVMINCRGPIYRSDILKIPKIGIINCHMGLLPMFRGMNVAEWSVIYGYPTGNTVHFIDDGIDTGDIIAFFPVTVEDCENTYEMRSKLGSFASSHTVEALKMIKEKETTPQCGDQGMQFFSMHQVLLDQVNEILRDGYTPTNFL